MCGITGFFSYKNTIDTKKYYDAHLKIAHRGPDDEGFICKNKHQEIEHLIGNDSIDELRNREFIFNKEPSSLILGHRRLSIIDLTSAGHQPFVFEDLYLTYNGEIYNYLELREELKELGYSFITESDTEVFLKAYHCWGVDSFNRFNGMWAAAIYDFSKDSILLTRDRFGIKPLYYSLIDDNLVFGSEIKFVSSFMEDKIVNKSMVFSYLRYPHLEHTEETFIQDIYSLEEGSYSIYDGHLHNSKYYQPSNRDAINLEKALDLSLMLRMRSDVEVGALLSGGIDSPVLVCKLRKTFNIKKIQTFTADFREKRFSERGYVNDVLKETGYNGLFINIEACDVKNSMKDVLYTRESPVRSMSVFLQYEIFKYIKENTNVKVTLSGQGADEIFSGYTSDYYYYLVSVLLKGRMFLFWKEFVLIKNILELSWLSMFKNVLTTFLYDKLSAKDKYGIFLEDIKVIKHKNKSQDYFKGHLRKNFSFSALKEYLIDEDKNSMRFSIESRLPYLDYRLVEEAFSLSSDEYIKNGRTKYKLREIAKGLVPKSILKRKDKMGFVSPQEVWQKNELKDDFDKVFEDIRRNGIFEFLDHKKIYSLYVQYQDGDFQDWSVIWRFYCLYRYKQVWNILG
jgi:asparagine synthase (glutamine-hydrolysing)